MRFLTVPLSALLVCAFAVLQWQTQWKKLDQMRDQRQAAEQSLLTLPRIEAGLEAREKALAGLRAQVDRCQQKLAIAPASRPEELAREWMPLTRRAGLTVTQTGLTATDQPALALELKAEGPRDEVFRLLDGMLRLPRPYRLEGLDMTCSADRARATMHWSVYWR